MAQKILTAIAVIIVVLAMVIAFQPAQFQVTRSETIKAPAIKIFPHVNTLAKWKAWSPWAELDPNAKETLEGPEQGEGAILRWEGNKEVGKGSMTIVESQPNELVRFRLDFLEPFVSTSTAEFRFKGDPKQTTVTWSMSGEKNFIAKAMGLIMNCDKMIGSQFEKGLANMKNIVEGTSKTTAMAIPK